MKRSLMMTALILWVAGTARGQARHYELAIDSAMQVRSPGQPKPKEMTAVTLMSYGQDRKDDAEEVSIHSLQVKVSAEGKALLDRFMSRERASFQQGPETATVMPFDQAPASLQKILKEFDVPLARLTLDDRGAETERTILVEKDSMLIENGMLENALLMHPPYSADLERWEAPAKFSMGNNQFARGNLTYQKVGTEADGTVKVDVTGELKADGKFGPADIKTAIYKVKGTQWFDPATKSWSSGQWGVDVTLELLVGGNPAGTTTGTMKLGLESKSK